MEINQIPIQKICYGYLLERDDHSAQAGLYNVFVYDAPNGPIARTIAKLAYSPGTKNNFKTKDHVVLIMNFVWNTATRAMELNGSSTHLIIGRYEPPRNTYDTNVNPNRDIPVPHVLYLNEKSQSGLMAEDTGTVRIFTNAFVKEELAAKGNGTMENMHRIFAQNFHRVISNMHPFYYAREFFGYFIGNDITEKTANTTSKQTLVAFKRFVLQNGDKNDRWVSTNEGAFCPWLGNNNEVENVTKTKEILYNKVINYEKNRITIFGGEKGPGFFTFRVDKIELPPLAGEKLNDDGTLTPPLADCAFYLGISEEGEVLIEAGIDTNKNQPAMQLKISKDGAVNWQVGSKFTINGKRVVTEDLIDFMKKHQADLVQVSAIGAPAPMSPSAAPDFTEGQKPGKFLTDIDKNPMNSAEAPVLEST
jgi:hypothetical protein